MIKTYNCPDCGSNMILRKGKFGSFYGCNAFPNCRGTRTNRDYSPKDYENDDSRYEMGFADDDLNDIWHPGHPSNYGDN